MGKKVKKAKKAKVNEPVEEIPTFEIPEFIPSRIDQRIVHAKIKPTSPTCALLEFPATLTLSTTVGDVARLIIKRHDGALRQVRICVHRFHPDEILDSKLTLEGVGVTEGDCLIYYDIIPITEPLIN